MNINQKVVPLLVILLVIASFLGGSFFTKIRMLEQEKAVPEKGEVAGEEVPAESVFDAPDQEKPEVEFFVMSFCPYGNQAEEGLKPVYELLKDKVSWQPRYIVADKKASCELECQYQVFDEARCNQLIEAQRIPDMETCREYFPYETEEACLEENCQGLAEGEYTSLHGEQELNQDIREICVFKELGVEEYWQFVSKINEKCSSQDADSCWLGVAGELGLDEKVINTCFNNRLQEILKEELEVSTTRGVTGSPTVFINGQPYQGGRAPEDYKQAICSGFKEVPEECGEVLGEKSKAPAGEGC